MPDLPAERARCFHPALMPLDDAQLRGWRCEDCGIEGPTVVSAELDGPHDLALKILCVCGAGWMWPGPTPGEEVARFLAEHAECESPSGETARKEIDDA